MQNIYLFSLNLRRYAAKHKFFDGAVNIIVTTLFKATVHYVL